jgi:UDP-N-acetylmuramate--alanine ligase
MKMPLDCGLIHFIGIGGVGMSGIAELMSKLGYTVQGSDTNKSTYTDHLRACGIPIFIGHDAVHLTGVSVIVTSSAIKLDNVEYLAARERRIPILRRADMLAELMRIKSCIAVAGAHGKTTTTSLVAAILEAGGLDPTVVNGGIINAYGTNTRYGMGEWMVVEADESDGSFLSLPANVAIVTNIDPEHLDHFGSFEALKDAFYKFVKNIPFYGFAVLCIDNPEVSELVARVEDRRIITYGESVQADARLINVVPESNGVRFSFILHSHHGSEENVMQLDDLFLPVPGRHNALNAVSAIATALALNVPADVIRQALLQFKGVKRRFTCTGIWQGVRIIDDYAHHPSEISAVLQAARDSSTGKLIAVMQPHRYTRLASLFDHFCTCFNQADHVLIAPVYSAGESPIERVDHEALATALKIRGHRNVSTFEANADSLAQNVRGIAKPGDTIICLGAGSITYWAQALPDLLGGLQKIQPNCA